MSKRQRRTWESNRRPKMRRLIDKESKEKSVEIIGDAVEVRVSVLLPKYACGRTIVDSLVLCHAYPTRVALDPQAVIETLRERVFKPTLSTIITESTKVGTVSPSDPVYVATKKMRELRVNSVVITAGNSLQGIFTSKDVLMRVVAQNLHPELTLVEKVMTVHPDCATVDTAILDALHIMHDGKFSHLPVLDGDGRVAACLDVLQLTHAAISMVEGGPGTASDVANTIMQKFWDSALALEPPEEEFDSHSESSLLMPSEIGDGRSSFYPPAIGNSCAFKLQDQKGRLHRFT